MVAIYKKWGVEVSILDLILLLNNNVQQICDT